MKNKKNKSSPCNSKVGRSAAVAPAGPVTDTDVVTMVPSGLASVVVVVVEVVVVGIGCSINAPAPSGWPWVSTFTGE